MTLIQIIFASVLVPKSQEISRSLIKSSNINFFEELIKPKVFNDSIKNLTVYADEKNKNEELKNIFIKKKFTRW